MGLVGFLSIRMVHFGEGLGWVDFYILYYCMYALKVVAGIGLLFGQPVMAHLGIPSSIPA
jgi:hypothetical protein